MFGGGGGLDPRKLQQMMDQMGIDLDELDAEEVIIRTPEEELVFDHPDVQRMEAQGQSTFQVVGEPDVRPRGETEGADETAAAGGEADLAGSEAEGDIPDSDVEIVAGRTGASEEEAREALRETDGDLAAAVERLE